MDVTLNGMKAKVELEPTVTEVTLDISVAMSAEQFDALDPEELKASLEAAAGGVEQTTYEIGDIPHELHSAVAAIKHWLGNNHPAGSMLIDGAYDTGFIVAEDVMEDVPDESGLGCGCAAAPLEL